MGKIVLITGASSGIGKATAIELLKRGHKVYGAARRVDRMKDIEELGGRAIYMDVTDDESVRSVVDAVLSEEHKIDAVFCNAGYGLYSTIEDASMEEILKQFNVNVFGTIRVIKRVLPHMRKRRSGTIVITSSIAGRVSTALLGYYAATKHALEAIGDALRQEVKDLGINVVLIEPGTIKTEFGDIALSNFDPDSLQGEYRSLAKGFKKKFSELYEVSPGPEVVAKYVVKAIESSKPKTRYVMGKHARVTLLLKKLLSDRLFDRFIRWYYRG